MRPIPVLLAVLLALGAVEGIAWWWMHPAPAGLGEPVLAYRPTVGLDRRAGPLVASGVDSQETAEARAQESGVSDQEEGEAAAQSSSSIPNSSFNIQNSSSSFTLLPDVVTKSMPSLRCSSGTAARIERADGATINVAYFEWDNTDTGSVLEAFRHMPEACMGSIGMILVSKEKPIPYTVRGQETGDRRQGTGDRRQGTGDRRQGTGTHLFFFHSKFKIQNSKFKSCRNARV